MYHVQAAHHAHGDGERAERARARAQRSSPRAIAARATSRSNGLRKALRKWSPASRCIAPTSARAARATRDRARDRHGDRPGPAPQPGDGERRSSTSSGACCCRPRRSTIRRPKATPTVERRARVRDEVPAVHRPGARQGRRGHGVLPLQRARLAERGRRRSRAASAARRPSSTTPTGAACERWPLEMIGTATHDTKRGEDVRARINVLSEMPDDWREACRPLDAHQRAARTTRRRRSRAGSQRRVSVLPDADRRVARRSRDAPVPRGGAAGARRSACRAYMQKAIKEAKVHTSWVNENQRLRAALDDFVEQHAERRRRAGVPRGVPAVPAPDRPARHDQLAVAARRSRWPRPASSTSTRAPSCGISHSSIPTTVGRSISARARRCSTSLTAVAAGPRRAARELDRRTHQDVSRDHAAAAAARHAGAVAGRGVSAAARRRHGERSSPRRVRAPARLARRRGGRAAVPARADALRHALAADRLRRVEDDARGAAGELPGLQAAPSGMR